jgi:pimeloyl-ACP methyl ester carboxylesterase
MLQPPGFSQHSLSTSLGEMVYYTADGAPWLLEEGSEEVPPTLVFLHGFGGGSSAYEWSKVYPAFASEYRILAPDLIGWGRSSHPARNYQIDDYLTTITEFLEATCDRPTTVIASSLTAAFTIRLAIARPELFKSLILTTPAGLSDFGENYTRSFFAQLVSTPIVDRFIYGVGVANELGIRSFLEQRQFARPERVYPEIVQAYLASAQQPQAEYSALSFVRGDLCFDLSDYISQLTVSTAIIWGQKSQFTGPDIGRRLAEMNPSAIKVFQVIEEVGLTPQLELPAVTIGLIRRFLSLLGEETKIVPNSLPDPESDGQNLL